MSEAEWTKLLIPIVTPFIVAAARWVAAQVMPHVPKAAAPALAGIVGAVLAGLSGVADAQTGALLGLAGVGVREVYDQGKRLTVTGPTPQP